MPYFNTQDGTFHDRPAEERGKEATQQAPAESERVRVARALGVRVDQVTDYDVHIIRTFGSEANYNRACDQDIKRARERERADDAWYAGLDFTDHILAAAPEFGAREET
jgi:hypothetical protein